MPFSCNNRGICSGGVEVRRGEVTRSLAGGIAPTGDLARDKVWAGATFDKGPFTATLLGRWMGEREPVTTNPLGTLPSYLVLEANVRVSHVGFDGLWLALRVANLLDSRTSRNRPAAPTRAAATTSTRVYLNPGGRCS